jgi:hypothetical protein
VRHQVENSRLAALPWLPCLAGAHRSVCMSRLDGRSTARQEAVLRALAEDCSSRSARFENARPHDIRHTVGTYGAQTGANAFLIRDQLGHKTVAMSARYVGRHGDPPRTLADQVEVRIAANLEGKALAEVAPLVGTARGARDKQPRAVGHSSPFLPSVPVLQWRGHREVRRWRGGIHDGASGFQPEEGQGSASKRRRNPWLCRSL